MTDFNRRTQYGNFGIVWASQTLTALLMFAVPALAPLLKISLGLSETEIGALVGIAYIGVSTMSTLFGVVADSIGIRKTLFFGHLIEAISIASASFAHNFSGLAFAFFGVGIGYGTISPVTSKAVLQWFSANNRSSIMGLKQTGVTVGGSLAGIIFPFIGVAHGLAASFLAGGVLVAIGSAFLLGYKEVESRSYVSYKFLRQGLSVSLRNRSLRWAGGVGFFFASVQGAVVTYVALFMQNIFRFNPITAALFLSVVNVAGTIGRPAFGFISDRWLGGDRVKDMLIIAIASSIMLFTLSEFPHNSSFWLIIPIIVILGFSTLGWNAVFLTHSGEQSAKGYEAVGTSFAFSIAMVGQVVGAPLYGLIVDSTGSYDLAWQIFGLSLLVASITYTMVGNRDKRARAEK